MQAIAVTPLATHSRASATAAVEVGRAVVEPRQQVRVEVDHVRDPSRVTNLAATPARALVTQRTRQPLRVLGGQRTQAAARQPSPDGRAEHDSGDRAEQRKPGERAQRDRARQEHRAHQRRRRQQHRPMQPHRQPQARKTRDEDRGAVRDAAPTASHYGINRNASPMSTTVATNPAMTMNPAARARTARPR